MKTKLPIFPPDEIDIGDNMFITIKHLRSLITQNYGHIADQYCIAKRFNKNTGMIEKQYAWHSIIEVLNSEGISEQIINQFYGLRKEKE